MILRSVLGPVFGVIMLAMAWAIGSKYVHQSESPVERTVQAVRQSPMIQAVLDDHPELEKELRIKIEANIGGFTQANAPEMTRFRADAYRQYFAPVLGNADDDSTLKLAGRLREFFVYLQDHDAATCSQLGLAEVSDLSRFDGGARIFVQRAVGAYVDAYRSGRAHHPQRPSLSKDELIKLLAETGTAADLAKLSRSDTPQGFGRCSAVARVLAALERLPADRGAAAIRFLLTYRS